MNKRIKIVSGIAAVAVVVVVVGIVQHRSSTPPQALAHATIGIQTSPAMALVMVAKDKGFFADNGVDVELKEFTAGKFALQAFLGGSVDYAVSGDVPAALAALQGNHIVVPAQVVRSTRNEVRVVARKDGNDISAADYFNAKKRKLATSFGGGPEFFTYRFLKDIGIANGSVEIVSQNPGDMPAALSAGSVDAIAIFDPFAYLAEKQLGDKATTFTNANIYSELYVLEAHDSVRSDSTTLTRILAGLKEAEDFVAANPDEAKQVVMSYTKLDKTTVDGIWGSFDFRVALTPQLLDVWNQEANWARATGKVAKDVPNPDFRGMIFDGPLRALYPGAVDL